jgi:hypothetical protein
MMKCSLSNVPELTPYCEEILVFMNMFLFFFMFLYVQYVCIDQEKENNFFKGTANNYVIE